MYAPGQLLLERDPHAQTISKMLQQITLAVLSLAAFLPSAAAAYHSPIDILRRGPVHATVPNKRDILEVKRDILEVHDDSFKRFSYYNKVTARTYCVCAVPCGVLRKSGRC